MMWKSPIWTENIMFYYLRCLAGVKLVSAVIGQSESSEMQRGFRNSS